MPDDWGAIDKARPTADGVPAGVMAVTVQEYADHYGLAYTTAFGQLQRLMRAGKMKGSQVAAKDGRGHACKRWKYWPC